MRKLTTAAIGAACLVLGAGGPEFWNQVMQDQIRPTHHEASAKAHSTIRSRDQSP